MATESPEPEAQTGASTRRKSGRVVRKPEHFGASSPAVSMKRKRTDAEEEAAEVEGDASEEEDEEEESEGEADEEELKEKRRRARKAAKPTQRKPAAKKTKTNGATHSLAIRPAGGKAKRPKKAKPLGDAAAEDAEGLYGMLKLFYSCSIVANSFALQLKSSTARTLWMMSQLNGLRAFRTTSPKQLRI